MAEDQTPATSAPAATSAGASGATVATQSNVVACTSLTQAQSTTPQVSSQTVQNQFQNLQSALQAVQPGLLTTGLPTEIPQVPIFAPGMAAPGPFSLGSLAGSLPTVAAPPVLDLISLTGMVSKLAIDHNKLLKSKRERDIDVEVGLFPNPMSKRAVEHDLRMSDSVESIVQALVFNNTIIQATPHNFVQINHCISLVLSSVQELRNRIISDKSKHLVAKTSPLGWRFVSSLEALEGQVGHISMQQLRSQEKAFLAHEQALNSAPKVSGTGGASAGGGGGGGGGGKGGNNNNKKGGGGKGAINKTKKGKVGKPKTGGCHRCGGGHFVRHCPKPVPVPVPE